MRRVLGICALVAITGLGVLAGLLTTPAHGIAAGTCTRQAKTHAQSVLRTYRQNAPAKRRAYFKKHRSKAARRAYDRKQSATLKRLRAAAACTVRVTTATSVPTTTSLPTTTTVTTTTVTTTPASACAPSLDPAGNPTNGVGTLLVGGVHPQATVNAVMLFVDFPDAAATETTSSVYNLLAPGAQTYFANESFGRLTLNVAEIPHWYRMSKASTDYGFGRGSFTFAQHRAYIQEAVTLADADVDFSRYQIVYVVSTKNATAINYSPAFVARHFATDAIQADGTLIYGGATFGTDIYANARWGWHVLAHETGHVFGLPDYYDIPGFDPTDYQHQFHYAGGWSIMSWVEPGGESFAWDKYREGWIDSTQINCLDAPGSITETLTPVEKQGGLKLLVAKTGASTAYAVEVRSLSGGDSGLCRAGVLVYALDARTQSGSGPLQVETTHPGSDAAKIQQCSILYDAPLQPGEAWEDATVRVEVLSGAADGSYSVRLTRK
jgi:M6 family metalloprotease-like protein